MKIAVTDADVSLSFKTKRLLQRMLSQICGLQQQVSFPLHGRHKPRVIVCGVELTGVHVLQGRPKPPGVSPYHIGGSGFFSNEALIRAVGETVERYSQLIAEHSGLHDFVYANITEIRDRGGRALAESALKMFSPEQYQHNGFPFYPIESEQVLAWVRTKSLIDGARVWAPAQMVLVGYAAKTELGEKRIAPAVTTGTAAHTDVEIALRSALLEAIQLDSSIGHWYSSWQAYRIENDSRTDVISRLIDKYCSHLGPEIEFFWIPNVDLPGFTIACLVRERGNCFPKISIGLGSELRLCAAMYKALLESVGVSGLSKVTLVEGCIDVENDRWKQPGVAEDKMFDLDANVLYFGFPEKAAIVERKFGNCASVQAQDIPPDVQSLSTRDEIRLLISAFRDTRKELLYLDLTTCDVRDLGFAVVRVWSPDTLSLSLPSAPPLKHPRLKAYGGAFPSGPHPYA
jgi:thiazole/oxazole-forming peptide maturase SagD family component